MFSHTQGFLEDGVASGALAGYPIAGCRMVIYDGASHLVDSSEYSFRLAAQGAMQQGKGAQWRLCESAISFVNHCS